MRLKTGAIWVAVVILAAILFHLFRTEMIEQAAKERLQKGAIEQGTAAS